MASQHGALVVFGSGPGVGRGVAAVFAEKGFSKVFVLSRNAERLKQDADYVRSANPRTSVHEIAVDVGDTEQLQRSLKKIEESLGSTPLESVLFNAARLGPSEILKFEVEKFEQDLKIAVTGLYAVAQWSIPRLIGSANASLLVTSGMLAKDPYPKVFALAACKAAQYSLAHSLHKEFESQGVHVGLIVIAGTVSDESKVTNARNIAEEAWKFRAAKGELELVLKDPGFDEHVKNRERPT